MRWWREGGYTSTREPPPPMPACGKPIWSMKKVPSQPTPHRGTCFSSYRKKPAPTTRMRIVSTLIKKIISTFAKETLLLLKNLAFKLRYQSGYKSPAKDSRNSDDGDGQRATGACHCGGIQQTQPHTEFNYILIVANVKAGFRRAWVNLNSIVTI
jgi:hypothetical protein